MAAEATVKGERPVNGAAKVFLVLGATAAILLCYAFSAVSMLLLVLLLALEAVAVVAAARFGMASFIVRFMQRHAALLMMFVRSLWLRKSAEYRIPLQRAEAPALFDVLDRMAARLAIAPPHEVSIEMNAGAWVRLRGYRRGAGRTILGLGYDLLAGLTVSEVEAVLAHEMTHAKLVQRGLKQWLNAGVGRVAGVTGALSNTVEAFRRAEQRFELAESFLWVADGLTALAARWVARYSRQDEFEADRGAAELCGAEPLRTSLCRLEAMAEKLARLPWPERVARLEAEASFHRWLGLELAVPDAAIAAAVADEARDAYSTHPSLRDRIAALPDIAAPRRDDRMGLALLAEPDRVAARLMTEIQRVVARQEDEDTKSLAKWAKKAQRRSDVRLAQVPGGVLVGAGVVVMLIALFGGFSVLGTLAGVVLVALGVWAWRVGRYRDRRSLPVPTFAALKRAWETEWPEKLDEKEKSIEADLKLRIRDAKKRAQIEQLLDAAHAALGACDYLRAHVAARLVLDRDNKSVDAALALAIASAALHQPAQMNQLLQFVQKHTGLATPGTVWGAAWALVLAADWDRAEAFLWRTHAAQPENATLLGLLALAQAARRKLQSAIVHAQQAVAREPAEPEYAKLLAQILLDAGRLREADAVLGELETAARSDAELAMRMVRLRLLRREPAAAAEWAATLRAANGSTPWVVRLGEAFEVARHDEQAARFFDEALEAGHHPDAHLGLARLAAGRKDRVEARRHLHAALDVEKTRGEKAVSPLVLFPRTLGQLVLLEEPRANCRAWLARFSHGPPPAIPAALANREVMIFAPDRPAAEAFLDAVLAAMQPANPPAKAATLLWREAPKDQQPVRPVRPGVQFVL